MQYFALLLSPSDAPEERTDPAALEAEMIAYNDFHARERSSIKAGDALSGNGRGYREGVRTRAPAPAGSLRYPGAQPSPGSACRAGCRRL